MPALAKPFLTSWLCAIALSLLITASVAQQAVGELNNDQFERKNGSYLKLG
jgi:hypothetical protein